MPQNTWVTKSSIIEKKILPYFGDKRVRNVKPVDVLHWQNIIMKTTDENGMPYSPVYLKTIHNHLSAMLIMLRGSMVYQRILLQKQATWVKRNAANFLFGQRMNICNSLKR